MDIRVLAGVITSRLLFLTFLGIDANNPRIEKAV